MGHKLSKVLLPPHRHDNLVLAWPCSALISVTANKLWIVPYSMGTQRLKTVALHLKLCILDRVFVKSSLVKRNPCKLREILVNALLRRSPHKIFLGGVPVTLPGVLVSLEGVLVS